MRKTKIAITYEKGGVGKTTTAVNLAAILAEKGFRVLLVDLDPQSYATAYFDLYNDLLPSITGVMMGKNNVKEAIRPTRIENLDILPGSYDFKDIETYLMMKTRRQEYTLRETMADVSDLYDFINLYARRSNGCTDYTALADEIIQRLEGGDTSGEN